MRHFQLAKVSRRCDFGQDFYFQFLFTDRWALFQFSASWNDYPSWPYIQLHSGSGSLLSAMFWVHRLGFDVGFLERSWKWDYTDNIEDIKEVIQ